MAQMPKTIHIKVRPMIVQGNRKVDPERIRRYLNRTLPRPPAEYHITEAEAAQVADFNDRWFRDDLYDLSRPPVFDWHNDVRRWVAAQGLNPSRDVVWIYSPAHTKPGEAATCHWEVRTDAR